MLVVMRQNLNRRQALGALGAVSLGGLLAACGGDEETTGSVTSTTGETSTVETKTSPAAASGSVAEYDSAATCTVATELTEGPFYFDVDSIRADLREDREGTLLRLGIRVRDAGSCEPIENAVVDVWHCDATGLYSGFESASTGGPGGGSGRTDEETYLRGAQATNSDGIVEFKTIYPGWYRGRTTHIHLKVHLDRQTVLTTQLFTNTAFDEKVYAGPPYAEDTGRDTFNDSDGIYAESGELTLSTDGDAVRGLITLDVETA
jgi:protocatechuate 3,4-dioxygenase beta subunit